MMNQIENTADEETLQWDSLANIRLANIRVVQEDGAREQDKMITRLRIARLDKTIKHCYMSGRVIK